jgi:hypothetical protein
MKLRCKLVALVVLAMAAPACGGHLRPSPAAAPVLYGQGALRNLPCVVDGSGVRSCGGLLPAARGLVDHLQLDRTRVAAGTAIRGALVVTNDGDRTVNLAYKGCRPSYMVALTTSTFAPQYGFVLPCEAQPLAIKARTTTALPISVSTSDLDARCTPATQAAVQGVPTCLANGMAPLPVGTYFAVLVGQDLALPPPAPVVVTVVRGS